MQILCYVVIHVIHFCIICFSRMKILPAVLFVSLVVAHGCSSLPKRSDSIRNTIRSITNIAQTTLVHIRILRAKVCTVLMYVVETVKATS